MSRFLGLDVGTQGTKAIVIDLEQGEVVGRAAHSYGLIEGLGPGAAEQHPETWWSAVRTVVQELGETLAGIAGIGVSGQQHGFVPLDGEGSVIRPAKLWCDTETAAEARELDVATGFTASKILWLARNEPENYARLEQVLLPHDWIDMRLTGETWMECGDASGTGFFDPHARRFDHAAIAAIDARLGGMLPGLVAPSEPAGELSHAAARELGLPAGTPIAPGGGDNMLSAIGSGAVHPGVCVLSLGTSGTVFAYSETPVVDPAGLIAPFCDSTGGWLPLLCVMNATGVLEEVRTLTGCEHAELATAGREVAAGCDGLLFVPYLAGERVPDLPEATGTLLGLRSGTLGPGRLYRAALEGTSLNLAWGIDRMSAMGIEIERLRIVGGGAKNELWCRILASATEAPVERLAEAETAALGAALQAAWVVTGRELHGLTERFVRVEGECLEPERRWVEVYRGMGERFRNEVGRLYGE